MFGSWLRNFILRSQIMLGLVALCWALWLNRNDTVFDKKNSNSPLQVIYRETYWIRQ